MTVAGSLAGFEIAELGQFTTEGPGSIPAGADHWLFYVGRDDVHGILLSLLTRVTRVEVGNMFGYDDEALNAAIMASAENPEIVTFWTLDRSQAGGAHEKAILASNAAKNPAAYAAHFAVIQSATGQISHTKGGVLDGVVGFEGSTNWSASGEGTFVTKGKAGGAGYKAQNNTLMVFTDPTTINRFAAELQHEHTVAHIEGGTIAAAKGAH